MPAKLVLTRRMLCVVAVLCLGLSGGCAEFWPERADRQVYDILQKREIQTLGYQPQVEAGPEYSDVQAPRRAYELVPQTRIAETDLAALEPEVWELPFAPLGPQLYEGVGLGEGMLMGVDAAQSRILAGLRLGPPAPAAVEPLRFELFDCIRYAVEHNRAYRSRMEDLFLATLDVTLERHLLSPRPFAGVGASMSRSGAAADYNTALTVTGEAGVSQRLPYGGEVVASALVSFVDALDGNLQNGETADLALRASVPLLRGAGLVNLEPLIQRERTLVYEIRAFERYRRGFAVDVASQYFSLLTRRQSIRNRYLLYLSSLQLVARTEALFAAGVVDRLEVQRAQQQALGAEDSLNQAEQAYEAALDRFKLFLGMDVLTPLEIVPIELTVPEPDLDAPDLLEIALRYRLDLQTARDRVLDAQRAVEISKNGLLPDLDLSVRGRVGNDANDPAARITGDDANVTAGLDLELPLDRLRERNTLRRSLINLERAVRRVEEVEDQVIIDVRDATRQVGTALTTLRLQREGIEIARERLEFANTSLLLGRSDNSRNVVEAQNALLAAQNAFDEAQADLQVAVLNFLLDTGRLRVDPRAGTLGQAMNRGRMPPADAVEPSSLVETEGRPIGAAD